MKKFLKLLSKLLGFLGFSFMLAAVIAGYIAEGQDIKIVFIVGFGLLILAAATGWICEAIYSHWRNNLDHITFPDS